MEHLETEAGDAVGDRDGGQAIAGRERRDSDAGDSVGNSIGSGFAPRTLDDRYLALVEQNSFQIAVGGIARIHRYRGKVRAASECIIPDAGDTAGNRDTRQARAFREDALPYDLAALDRAIPVYEVLPGWKQKTRGVSRIDELPKNALRYLDFLEQRSCVEIGCISTGPERNETIINKRSALSRLLKLD